MFDMHISALAHNVEESHSRGSLQRGQDAMEVYELQAQYQLQ